MNSKANYNVGDEVLVSNTNEKGIIKSIVSELSNSNSVYVVNINGLDRLYVESCLELVKRAPEKQENISIKEELDTSINEIIEELKLNKSNLEKDVIINALKVSRYLALRDNLIGNFNVKDNIKNSKLYDSLLSQEDSYLANSYLFSRILKKIGIDVLMCGLKDEEDLYYISNLVLIGDNYYYFDNTLEREVYLDNCDSDEEFLWCCAALGKNSYEQFFKPVCIINLDDDKIDEVIPANIAMNDYDIDNLEIDEI